ncbi:MAG: type ISP restriction/modification enzyme [Verrucomicrobiota bacterium]
MNHFANPRREVMQHIVGHKNVGMIFNRQIVGDSVSHFSVARIPICHGTFYLGNKGQDYFAPLLAFDDDLLASRKSGRSNFTPFILTPLRKALGSEAAKLTPEDIFHHAYAVFHSPGYRSRYVEFLKIDFPRLPLTGRLELFRALAQFGAELTALRLLESPELDKPITEFIGRRDPGVEKVSWSKNTVWVDKAQSTGFRGVREEVWDFRIGG